MTTDTEERTFTNQPVSSLKVGHGIEVATWKQKGQYGDFETASISRSYQDSDGNWQSQKLTNMTPDALLAVSQAAGQAYIKLMERQHSKGRGV